MHFRRPVLACCALLCPLALACGSKPCDDVSGTCVELASGASEATVSSAFSTAKPGTTLAFGEGTFAFTNALGLAAKNVTVKGMGLDKTILDFKAQAAGAEGIGVLDGSDGISFRDLALRDPKGNGIKVVGSTGVTFRNVKVTWTDADKSKHGAYGLYPVSSKNVLIDGCIVEGAADAGIYVGQSQKIIVRNSTARFNVAGIEIENSFDADVTNNLAEKNTGGILVFDLPGLPQSGGHGVRVYNNQTTGNNTPNFAASGTVGLVPSGTGMLVMANHDVEVFGNTITGNNTVGVALVSYYITQLPITDPNYNPLPAKVHVRDNKTTDAAALNGTAPDVNRQLGLLLYANKSTFPGGRVSDVVYDGIVDPSSPTPGVNKMQICVKGNTASPTFANLHFADLKQDGSNLSEIMTFDAAPYDCSLPALPAVTF